MTAIERGSGNVYADLGFTDAEEMLVKAQLVTKIGAIIKQRKLTQQQTAELVGISPGRVSTIFRGPFHSIAETKQFDFHPPLCRINTLMVVPHSRRTSHTVRKSG